jgi:hypothetical protein
MSTSASPPEPIALHLDSFGRLVLERPGTEPVTGVVPVRCFPFTSPTERISLCDESGREVHFVADLADLPEGTRDLLQQELARREFIPTILRIHSITPDSEPTSWNVDTERGPARFLLASEDHVRRLPEHGVLVSASDGVRFRVVDTRRLDARSRKLLRRYL